MRVSFIAASLAATVVAQSTITNNSSGNVTTAQEPCARVSATLTALGPDDPTVIPAEDAYQCLTSVPLDIAGNLQLVQESRQYLDWQSTLTYLRNPPQGYQEPATDILAKFDNISAALQQGKFQNEYQFQSDFSDIYTSAHDGHFYWSADLLGVFTFQRPSSLTLVQVSSDGAALPKVYLYSDILEQLQGNRTASAVSQINGQNVTELLIDEASTHLGQDPDANYNVGLFNQAVNSMEQYTNQAANGSFISPSSYPGASTSVLLEDGSTYEATNAAVLSPGINFTGISNGKDFFQKFCQGPSPAQLIPDTTSTNATLSSNSTPLARGYPSPVALMKQLSVGGYYLDDQPDTAVLSIPAFYESSSSAVLQSFSDTVDKFLKDSKAAGKEKLIVDLRGNPGGSVYLAFDTFKHLFPALEPYQGVRGRANDAVNILGTFFTKVFQSNPIPSDILEIAYIQFFNWIAETTPTGQAFSSWNQFFGPYELQSENYTALFRSNLSNFYETQKWTVYGYGNRSITASNMAQPYSAENIVLLYDGQCASTCAVFSELMKTQGRVKSIVMGGRPQSGPMQSIGQVKGAQVQSWSTLNGIASYIIANADKATAAQLNSTALGALANATKPILRAAWSGAVAQASVNVLNDYRRGDETQTPLQFVYEPADCRLWYTPAMIANVTNTWKTVAHVQWGGMESLCVPGSCGVSGSLGQAVNGTLPGPSSGGTTVLSDATATGNVTATPKGPTSSPSGAATVVSSTGAGHRLSSSAGAGLALAVGLFLL